jgi:hypothetical protein
LDDDDFSNNGKSYGIRDVSGHVTITNVEGERNTTNVSVSGDIKVDEDILSNLESEFNKSITDFTDILKEELENKIVTPEQINTIKDMVDELAKEFEGTKPDTKIPDEEKVDDIKFKLRNLAEALVALSPVLPKK